MRAPQVMAAASDKDGPNLESSSSGIHWSSILGGAAVAAAISLMLLPLGTAFGFSSFSIFGSHQDDTVRLTATAAIWLVVTQWISSGVGGYIAGRLRVKWADLHSDEVFFRDTAHGFIAWAVATLFVSSVVALVSLAAAAHPVVDADTANAAQQVTAQAAEAARKAAAGASIVFFLSLLIGAFIASVAAALGGKLRDQY